LLAGVLLASGFLLAGGVCPAAEPPAPRDATVVALGGVGVPEVVASLARRVPAIESAVAAWLRARDMEAVASSEFEAAWQNRVQQAGGYFDIVTGRPDLVKRRALRASALRELYERRGAGVLLQPELVVVAADYANGKAAWDSAKETAAPTGSGELPALSLAVRVEDLTGREVASARAGIQLLAKYSIWNGKYGEVPQDKLLADEAQLRAAVNLALSAVLDALRAPPVLTTATESPSTEVAAEPSVSGIQPPPAGAKVAALRAPLLPQGWIVVPDDVALRYLGCLRERLEQAGWWVLPAGAFEGTLRGIALERGGIYDPITGRGDDKKLIAAVGETRRQLGARYGTGVFVTPGFYQRSAQIIGETANWDGVSENVADIPGWQKLLVSTHGTTRALSFGVTVEDADGTTLHTGLGGIGLTERLERGRFVHVPPEELFADPARDRRAVDRLVGGWLPEPSAVPTHAPD
jgi:hypothetical protein